MAVAITCFSVGGLILMKLLSHGVADDQPIFVFFYVGDPDLPRLGCQGSDYYDPGR